MDNKDNISDLIKDLKDGDEEALREFYDITKKDAWFTCRSIMKNDEDALEAFQNAYIDIIERPAAADSTEKLLRTVRKVSAKKCGEIIKSRETLLKTEDSEFYEEGGEEEELTVSKRYIENEEHNIAIMHMMESSLSMVQYQIIVMYRFAEVSLRDIAAYFGCTKEDVQKSLRESDRKLQKAVTAFKTHDQDSLTDEFESLPLFPVVFAPAAQRCTPPEDLPVVIEDDGTVKATVISTARSGKRRRINPKLKIFLLILAVIILVGGSMAVVIISNLNSGSHGGGGNISPDSEDLEDPTVSVSSEIVRRDDESSAPPRKLDPKKDITVTTLSAYKVPYQNKLGENQYHRTANTCTLFTLLVESKYNDITDFSVKPTEETLEKISDTTASLCFYHVFGIKKGESDENAGYLVYVTAFGEFKPSDFVFCTSLDNNSYSAALTDTVSKIPDELISDKKYVSGNLIKLGDKVYYAADNTRLTETVTEDDPSSEGRLTVHNYVTCLMPVDFSGEATLSSYSFSFAAGTEQITENDDPSQITSSVTVSDPEKVHSDMPFAEFLTLSLKYPEDTSESGEDSIRCENTINHMLYGSFIACSGTPVIGVIF